MDFKSVNKIGHIEKTINVELDLTHTDHSMGRQGRGSDYITNDEIKNVVSLATEQIIDAMIANTLNNGDSVLITQKESKINVVGALSVNKSTDVINFKVITVMRVDDFINKKNTKQFFV